MFFPYFFFLFSLHIFIHWLYLISSPSLTFSSSLPLLYPLLSYSISSCLTLPPSSSSASSISVLPAGLELVDPTEKIMRSLTFASSSVSCAWDVKGFKLSYFTSDTIKLDFMVDLPVCCWKPSFNWNLMQSNVNETNQ